MLLNIIFFVSLILFFVIIFVVLFTLSKVDNNNYRLFKYIKVDNRKRLSFWKAFTYNICYLLTGFVAGFNI